MSALIVKTRKALDALPTGTVVMDGSRWTWTATDDGLFVLGGAPGRGVDLRGDLPVTVLYEPSA